MKNILFVGPYRQNDGWGNASKEYIRALKLTGHNLSVRPVYLNSQTDFPEFNEFNDLEQTIYHQYDIIIQNCLPNMFRYYGGCINIGLAFFETTIKYTPWVTPINLMDQMWVTSYFEKNLLQKSGVNHTSINVIRIPCDENKYENDENYKYNEIKEHNDEFKFYFIGEDITRKNINDLIVAFNREFNRSEQVRLILKVNKTGKSPEDVLLDLNRNISNIKRSMGIYSSDSMYKQEIIIPGYITDNELMGLHKFCDCFVMPSSGEALCMPAFDATAFGNNILVNKNSSMKEYHIEPIDLINSHKVPAIAHDRPLPYLYNGRDEWYKIDILDLQRSMRILYEERDRIQKRKEQRKIIMQERILDEYSYNAVAMKIKDLI